MMSDLSAANFWVNGNEHLTLGIEGEDINIRQLGVGSNQAQTTCTLLGSLVHIDNLVGFQGRLNFGINHPNIYLNALNFLIL